MREPGRWIVMLLVLGASGVAMADELPPPPDPGVDLPAAPPPQPPQPTSPVTPPARPWNPTWAPVYPPQPWTDMPPPPSRWLGARRDRARTPKAHRPFDHRWNLFAVGTAVLTTSYLACVAFGGFLGDSKPYYIPLAGPLIAGIAHENAAEISAAVLASGTQLVGAVLMAVGAWQATHEPEKRPSLSLSPVVSRAFSGLSLQGEF